MNVSRSIPGLRVFVEGVVIVGSILLAFGIDAWWDEVQEQAEVRQDLASVSQELAANREHVLFEVDLTQRIADGTGALTEIMGAASASGVVSIQDTLVFLGTMVPSTLDVSFGAVDALFASGRLARIENPSVRRRLAGLRDLIEDAVEGEQRGPLCGGAPEACAEDPASSGKHRPAHGATRDQ